MICHIVQLILSRSLGSIQAEVYGALEMLEVTPNLLCERNGSMSMASNSFGVLR